MCQTEGLWVLVFVFVYLYLCICVFVLAMAVIEKASVSDGGFVGPQQANKGGSQALNRGLIMHSSAVQTRLRLRHNRLW